MLQGLMHHIVLQQRVTLDWALLFHLQDCLLTPYTEDMHNHTEHTRFSEFKRHTVILCSSAAIEYRVHSNKWQKDEVSSCSSS